jgi:undecaprenyl-diphosphatase
MISIIQAIVLGAIQGLSEFLPISSSGHLILAHWVFKNDLGLAFDVALHWGTLLAVVVYFRNDVWLIIKGFWHSLFKSTRDLQNNIYQKLSWLIIIASVPGAVIGKLLESKASTSFRDPVLVAMNLAVFGVVIFVADKIGKKEKNLDKIKWTDALFVGLAQALAIIPGISRSGATMAAALFLAFKRPDAARFSFLMSIPIIFGAGILELPDLRPGVSAELLAGFASATIFGFLAIKYLLRYLSRHDFKIFVWYRLALAAVVLGVYFLGK